MEEVGQSLDAAVAALIGPESAAGALRRELLAYDAFFAHRTLTRVSGRTSDGQPWSLIEKRTEGTALADAYLTANAEREFAAFTSGFLDLLGPRVRAPRLLGARRDTDGALTLWEEDVRDTSVRPLGRSALVRAASDLGDFGGRWNDLVPSAPWLFDGWIDRHSQPRAVLPGRLTVQRDPVGVLGRRTTSVLRLIDDVPYRARQLEALPQTLCHHDAVGSNVLRDTATVLIDWESIGPGPLGADLASLLISSVRRGDAMLADVRDALEEALGVYIDSAITAGAAASAREIESGFDAAVALRWKLAADLAVGGPLHRGSLPDEDPATARTELDGLLDIVLERASHTSV